MHQSTKNIIDELTKNMATVSFSIYCMSGHFGDKCNCCRCQQQRGVEVTTETEELSKLQSIIYRSTGGIRDTVFHALRLETQFLLTPKRVSEIADNIKKAIVLHFKSEQFGNLPGSPKWEEGLKEVEKELKQVADGAKVNTTKLNQSFDI